MSYPARVEGLVNMDGDAFRELVEYNPTKSTWELALDLNTGKCPGYDFKPCDGEVSVLELSRMQSFLSLPLLPSPLWSRVAVSVRVSSMCQIEISKHLLYLKPFNVVQTND